MVRSPAILVARSSSQVRPPSIVCRCVPIRHVTTVWQHVFIYFDSTTGQREGTLILFTDKSSGFWFPHFSALSSPHMQTEHTFFFIPFSQMCFFFQQQTLLFPLPTCSLNAKIKLEPESFNLANEIPQPNPHYVIFCLFPPSYWVNITFPNPSVFLDARLTGFYSDTLSRRVFVNHIECFHGLYEHVNDQRREKGRSLGALKKQSERSGRVCAASGGSCRRGVFNSIPQNTDCFIIRQLSAAAAPVILSDV